MNDPFQDRIDSLLEDGKITPEEAERLRAALDTRGEPASDDRSPGSGFSSPILSSPMPRPPEPPRAPAAPDARDQSPTKGSPEPVTRVRHAVVSAMAGEIRVEGRDGLDRVRLSGQGQIELYYDGDTARVTSSGRLDNPTEIGWLDTVFRSLGRVIPVDVRIEVPADLETLRIKALAGDVDVRGVRGRVELDLQAGDLDLRGASSFKITTKAGDVNVKTRLADGDSSISALAGDLDVQLESGSDVTIQASVQAGELETRGFTISKTDKRLTGGTVEGRAGAGSARLDVTLTAGNVSIRVPEGGAA